MSDDGWTIDELARQVADTLVREGVHVPNDRVTAVPDRRVIRWYATIGLLDRPLRTGGRTARYGERHLLQLVAIKRRQAQGCSLTAIQAELAGATDRTLRRVAALTDPPAAPVGAVDDQDRAKFWRHPAGPVHHPPPPVYPVPLHPAATLVLSGQPTADDLAAIHAAAGPLLDLLASRGLLTETAGTTEPAGTTESAGPPSRRPL